MKKLLAGLLAGCMLMSLAACGSSSSSSTAASSSAAASSGAASSSAAASSSSFPGGKNITIICPYAAGGASDTTSRVFATALQNSIGTTVMVSDVTGGSGAVGLEQVRQSKADGYTIAYMPVESTMMAALGYTDLTTNDFKFLCRVMTIPAAITVRSDSKWQTFADFLSYAKDHPGEISVGNSGAASIWAIAAHTIESKAGVSFNNVPYSDGAAAAVADLMGGNVDAVAVSPSEVKSGVDSGDFRVLTVLGEKRSTVVPDVQTATEQGYDIVVQGWGGFAVPKDTPDDVLKVLQTAAEKACQDQSLKDLLSSKGYEYAYLGGADMDKACADQLAFYQQLIPTLGIKVS